MSSEFPNESFETPPAESAVDLDSSTASTPKPDRSSRHSWAGKISLSGFFSWVVIISVTIGLCLLASFSLFTVVESEVSDASAIELFPVQMQGKMLLGQRELAEMAGARQEGKEAIGQTINSIDNGGYEQRLAVAILKNEFSDAETALDYLDLLDQKADKNDLELTENQQKLRQVLERCFQKYDAGNFDSSFLDQQDRELVSEKLQWLGELALLPAGTPQETERKQVLQEASTLMILMIVGFLLGLAALITGFVVGIVLLIMAIRQKLTPRFLNNSTNHNIYAETFAIWMVIFFGASQSLGFFVSDARTAMIVQPLIFFGSLICLFWPVARGISFRQVLEDIGWTAQRPLGDLVTAPLSYLSTLPMMIPALLSVLIITLIVGLFQPAPGEFTKQVAPGHPIQEFVINGDVVMLTMVFVAVCICAPVVEETMFRGVLYRHLRDLTGNWSRWISVPISASVNGVVFAACHPQGIIAVPMLATLAIGFSFAREWRGSLLSPMLMHAIHNGLLTCIMLLIL